MILVSTLTCRAACPDSIRQQKMLEEEQAFLANMKPGLQHIQMMAVRKAMEGNDTELQQIRQSRNQPPTLPEGVKTFYPRERTSVSSLPNMRLTASTPSCSTSMAVDGALAASTVARGSVPL